MSARETIGLLGGSFNPVHIGHLMLAAYLTQWGIVDKVWLLLSPRNPLKDPAGLIPDMRRLAMLSIATKGADRIETCDIELSMPKPSKPLPPIHVNLSSTQVRDAIARGRDMTYFLPPGVYKYIIDNKLYRK